MRQLIVVYFAATLLIGCGGSDSGKKFLVSGTISNNKARMIYLEKIPATMQPVIADSAEIEKNGSFSLQADAGESVVYNLRLDQNRYPVASVINDAEEVKLNIQLGKDNSEFAVNYEVEGSPASKQMKDFMYTFNTDLQKLYGIAVQTDSVQKAGAADTALFPLLAKQRELADKVKKYSEEFLKKANDPALIMFELGYYQSSANNPGFGLEPLSDEEVTAIVTEANQKFPTHHAVAAIKATLDRQVQQAASASWIGKEAPDFSMPDVNGKEVKLSSFRGKYVLVDFWASWCGPCRKENPNLVDAYNQFKDKNFTVLGVSLDRPGQKDKWLQAIKDDKLAWTNISDLQFWSSPVVSLYGFDGIPFNVLVDPQGKVIAEGLRGSSLEGKLKEVLQ